MLTIEMDNFDLGQICRSGQCFRMDQIGDDRYRVIAGDKYLELTQERGIVNFFCPEEDFIFFWIRYFDLDHDYNEYIQKINPRDKYLTAAGEMGSGIRILQQDLWEMIISFLISQQNNITRIKKCIENISREFGEKKESSTGAEYYAFPTARALASATEEQLRECNLGYRAKYVLDTARKVFFGDISLESIYDMTYKNARKELLNLYGVGEKVADCICLFGLHQLDAFPIDTHIRQALDAHYKRGFPNRRYKGFRGVMQQYIFYYELEYVFETLMKKPITISDGSALVTGMILGLNMPPTIPLWIPVLGGMFAIIVVKQLYGGLGQNWMNPALAARCFLLISFAGSMTRFTDPVTDAVAGATPLAVIKAGGEYDLMSMFIGKIPGTIGEVSFIALLIGAAYLLVRKVISIRIPATYILTFAVFAFIFGRQDMGYVLAELCGGGLIFGAFFMATDYVTSPITPRGQIIFGVCLGILTGLFRIFGGSAEGVSYAIIFCNMLVPLIERVTIPTAFGKGGKKHGGK